MLARETMDRELGDLLTEHRLLVDNYAGALLLFDTELRYLIVGGTNLEVVGWTRQALEGRTIWDAFPSATATALEPMYRAVLGGESLAFDMAFEARTYEVEIVPVRQRHSDVVVAGLSSTRDVTIERQVAAALDEAQECFRTAFDHAPIGMAIVELDGRYRSVNPALCGITGHSEIELCRQPFEPDGQDAAVNSSQLQDLRDGQGGSSEVERQYPHARGHLIWIRVSVSLVRNGDGTARYFIAQVQDISEHKRQEAALRRQAERDGLTGLWNRHRLEQELAISRELAEHHGSISSVILLDLDDLKAINDTFGHQAGDDALRRVGETISAGIRGTDVACRYGGDEFAVILPHTDSNLARQLAERLIADIARQRIVSGDHVVAISVSAGVADTTTGPDAVPAADEALYQAKRRRRS